MFCRLRANRLNPEAIFVIAVHANILTGRRDCVLPLLQVGKLPTVEVDRTPLFLRQYGPADHISAKPLEGFLGGCRGIIYLPVILPGNTPGEEIHWVNRSQRKFIIPTPTLVGIYCNLDHNAPFPAISDGFFVFLKNCSKSRPIRNLKMSLKK